MTHTAAILARGLGTRMRRADETTALGPSQAAVAASGVKGMIPIQVDAATVARPFLDYVLYELADVGVREVVLVIGPEHDVVRDYYTRIAPPVRVRVRFAIQDEPLGTANAVTVAAPLPASPAMRSATNSAGTTTITAAATTHSSAAMLRPLNLRSSQRLSGANMTASASAQASAGTNGAAMP